MRIYRDVIWSEIFLKVVKLNLQSDSCSRKFTTEDKKRKSENIHEGKTVIIRAEEDKKEPSKKIRDLIEISERIDWSDSVGQKQNKWLTECMDWDKSGEKVEKIAKRKESVKALIQRTLQQQAEDSEMIDVSGRQSRSDEKNNGAHLIGKPDRCKKVL